MRARSKGMFAWLALVTTGALAVRADSDAPRLPRPSLAERLRVHAPRVGPELPPPRILAGQDDFDVLDYDLSLSPVTTSGGRIFGSVAVTFTPAPRAGTVDELVLDLDDRMRVQAVTAGDGARLLAYSHVDGDLRITLDPPLASGSIATVHVRWWGTPRMDDGLGLQFSTYASGTLITPLVYTLCEPFLARRWWPCKDRPDDKATLTVSIRHDSDLTYVSNGALLSRDDDVGGYVTTTWRESHPIATYLVAIAGSKYETCTSEYASQGDPSVTMPVTVWSIDDGDLVQRACARWAVATDQLDFFARSFGEYPFLDEKYGIVMVQPRVQAPPLSPYIGMENQTMTTMGLRYVQLPVDTDALCAHELSHHWWGDSVGISGFDSIWLNEGLATYSEALWDEEVARRDGGDPMDILRDDMRFNDILQRSRHDFVGTVQDPVDLDDDGWPDGPETGPVATVYLKGAWVVHMLRWVLGQPSFAPSSDNLLTILRAHARENADRAVSTDEFVALAEGIAERQLGHRDGLGWFFDEWLHREGRPCYRVGWSQAPPTSGDHRVWVEVEQGVASIDADTNILTCEGWQDAPYRMPVTLTLRLDGGTVVKQVVDNRELRTRYELQAVAPVLSVGWDEDGWILKHVAPMDVDDDDDGYPNDVDGCPLVSNPEQEDVDLDGNQDACQVGLDYDRDGIPNEVDCAPADSGAWTQLDPVLRPDLESLLRVEKDGRNVKLVFTVPPPTGTERAYVSDVVQGRLERLRANRSYEDSTCLARGTLDTLHGVPMPAWSGTSHYYLVFPYNGCGATDGTGHLLSACR